MHINLCQRFLFFNNYMRFILLSFFFLLFSDVSIAQSNSARLVVLQGGRVSFNFIRLNQYVDGIELEDRTILGIEVTDLTASTLTGWRVEFQSVSGQTVINGENGNTLPLNYIEIRAENNLGLSPSTTTVFNDGTGDYQSLQSSGTSLIRTTDNALLNTNVSSHQIRLDYRCGEGRSLLGEESDYYTVEVDFILMPEF